MNCSAEITDAKLWLLSTYKGEITLSGCDAWVLNLRSDHSVVSGSLVDYLIGYCVDGAVTVEECEVQWMGLTGYSRDRGYHEVQAYVVDTTVGTCKLNYFHITDEVNVSFKNAVIGNLTMKPAPKFHVNFMDGKVTESLTLFQQRKQDDSVYIDGGVTFLGARLIDYPNTAMTRMYEVQVTEEGEPFEGVQVQILKEGEEWKASKTDSDGLTFFRVRWVNQTIDDSRWEPIDSFVNNITAPLTIKIDRGDGYSEQLSILSDTPIHIKISKVSQYMLVVTILMVIVLISSIIYTLRSHMRS